MTNRTLRVYGAGGAGVGNAMYFMDVASQQGIADVLVSLVDTSDSNLITDLNKENVFLLDNVDGAGKVRREHADAISNTVRQVLVEHRPADFNVVIFSASGGSGSVFGPLLIAEMLDRDIPVVGLVIGSNTKAIEAKNTVDTLKTLDHIARKRNKPVIISYEQNSKTTPRRDVDTAIRSTVQSLQLLVGTLGNGSGMDTADILNWIYYNKVSDIVGQLSLLEIILTEDAANEIEDPISVASVITHGKDPQFEFAADYGCEGFKSDKVVSEYDEIHYVVSIESVPELYRQAADKHDGFVERKASRPTQAALAGKNDSAEGDLIL